MKPIVDVVIVTYGERWQFLSQVLSSLAGDPLVSSIFVVDNCSAYLVSQRVRQKGWGNVHVLRMEQNLGSAGGFAAGLKAAASHRENVLVWLLDDDNRPGADALPRLLACHELLGRDPAYVLLAHRPSRLEQREALEGRQRIAVRSNSFAGFHIAEVPAKLRMKLSGHSASDGPRVGLPLVSIGYAPYGGLLLHKRWIDQAGLPARDFYLYGDDHEFTSRLVQEGAAIVLCGTSIVEDLETSWGLRPTQVPALISKHSDPRRLYLTLRNRAFWESRQFVGSTPMYFLNVATYLAFLAVVALLRERDVRAVGKRLRLLVAAIRAGRQGRLGPA
jgi:GT2 family glycosyltransferase